MTVLCSEGQYDNARAQLPDLCRQRQGRTPRHRRGFNSWGGEVDGLYPSWENDNRVAHKFCDLLGNGVYDKRDFICEGSSIHADG